MFYVNGDIYEGNWVNGEKNGKGTAYFKNGDIYEGEWVKGLPDGFGILKK